jgi:glutamine---fructose-6-phosphate transaminase (isomerizing)
MCGIVGIIGREPVAVLLVDALKRLEYRGYDSAGVATLENGQIARRRAEGKLKNLAARLALEPLSGTIGIGHTRWATHGKPTEANAHPHATDKVAVVHNGIIENFKELRDELKADGAQFQSETDSEVVAHLVTHELRRVNDPIVAVKNVLPRLHGAFALGFLFSGENELLIGARKGAPLAVGYGEEGMYLGSDAFALAPFTDEVAYLNEGDWVVLRRDGAEFHDAGNAVVERPVIKTQVGSGLVDKGNHRHFMAKEIHEQPEVIGRTIAHYIDMATGEVRLPAELPFNFKDIRRISISACGTASLAGLTARYWFERFARIPVEIDVASEFRYRELPLEKDTLTLFVSQSGETADTLASLRYAKEQGSPTLSVVNVATSTMARESGVVMPTLAGPEIGVASTKAFTCQLTVLAALAIFAGRQRGHLTAEREKALVDQLIAVPGQVADVLRLEPLIEQVAHKLTKATDVLYLGRGTSFPLALEGALKLKELSYIHAEGYAAGELKHGPIALIDEQMPVIVIAPRDHWFEKTVSNMQEVAARGGQIILIGPPETAANAALTPVASIDMPDFASEFSAISYAIPVQLLAYYTASIMGKDVDQPRSGSAQAFSAALSAPISAILALCS